MVQVILFPFDAILVSALQVACSVPVPAPCILYCVRPPRAPCTRQSCTNPVPATPARGPRVCQLATSNRTTRALTGPALSLRRLCYLQQSGTHSTRCACKQRRTHLCTCQSEQPRGGRRNSCLIPAQAHRECEKRLGHGTLRGLEDRLEVLLRCNRAHDLVSHVARGKALRKAQW